MGNLQDIESFIENVEQAFPRGDEDEASDEGFRFIMANGHLKTILFPRTKEELAAERQLPPIEIAPTKKGREQKRMQGLRAFLKREQGRTEVTRLNLSSSVERYQLIVRLRALQALQADKEHWANKRLEALIERIERGELPQTEEK